MTRTSGEPKISQYAINRLTDYFYKKKDFTNAAKQVIIDSFDRKKYSHNFLLVCGKAEIKELIPKLKIIANNLDTAKRNWYNTNAWYASLALARIGVNDNINMLISAVEHEPDTILHITRLLRYLAYTRQPACLVLLDKYLESSDELPNSDGMPRGLYFYQYVLGDLAKNLDNFPIAPKKVGYTKEELEIAREYMKVMLKGN